MIVVYDDQGIAHLVTNEREVREAASTYGYAEYWQVRVACMPAESGEKFMPHAGTRIADFGDKEHGDAVTCVRCSALPCDHGVAFDSERAKGMSAADVRRFFPRLSGPCPKKCGYYGIAYASHEHYVAGDW